LIAIVEVGVEGK